MDEDMESSVSERTLDKEEGRTESKAMRFVSYCWAGGRRRKKAKKREGSWKKVKK
jgi:hypothetical protein